MNGQGGGRAAGVLLALAVASAATGTPAQESLDALVLKINAYGLTAQGAERLSQILATYLRVDAAGLHKEKGENHLTYGDVALAVLVRGQSGHDMRDILAARKRVPGRAWEATVQMLAVDRAALHGAVTGLIEHLHQVFTARRPADESPQRYDFRYVPPGYGGAGDIIRR